MTTENKDKEKVAIYDELSRKWAIAIIKAIFLGYNRFNEFLDTHPNLSNGVLSEQLKRLEKLGFIKKNIVSTSPIRVEYELTDLGLSTNKLCYEKVMFAINNDIISRNNPYFKGKTIEEVFRIEN